MPTRKHFESAAEICREIKNCAEREVVASAFARYFAALNPRFDGERFYDAAKMPESAR